MELNQVEVSSIETAVREASDQHVRELNEMQLALVGGGIGDTAV